MDLKYLVDVNLPYRFSHWNTSEFIHQRNIDPRLADKNIWKYAKENDLTIVTKDADFAHRIINQTPPPRVIHFRTGNMRMNDFHDFITLHWNEIIELSLSHKLVNVYNNRIEGIQ